MNVDAHPLQRPFEEALARTGLRGRAEAFDMDGDPTFRFSRENDGAGSEITVGGRLTETRTASDLVNLAVRTFAECCARADAAASKEPLGGKLPSRFQLHDTVRAQGARGTVVAITFMLVDGWGKVAYDVDCGAQTLHRVLSDDVQPARPQHLKAVPTTPDPED